MRTDSTDQVSTNRQPSTPTCTVLTDSLVTALTNDRVVLEDLVSTDPDYAPSHTTFALRHPSRLYKLKADSQSESIQWKEAIFEVLRAGITLVGTPMLPPSVAALNTVTGAPHGTTTSTGGGGLTNAGSPPASNIAGAVAGGYDPYSSVSVSILPPAVNKSNDASPALAGSGSGNGIVSGGGFGFYQLPKGTAPVYRDDPARYASLLPEKPAPGGLTEHVKIAGLSVESNAVYFPTRSTTAAAAAAAAGKPRPAPTTAGVAPPPPPAAQPDSKQPPRNTVTVSIVPPSSDDPANGLLSPPSAALYAAVASPAGGAGSASPARKPVSYTTFESPRTGGAAGLVSPTQSVARLLPPLHRYDWHNRYARIWNQYHTYTGVEERCRRLREVTTEFTVEARAGAVALLGGTTDPSQYAESDRLTIKYVRKTGIVCCPVVSGVVLIVCVLFCDWR